jgi:hypothetical protein
MVPAMVFAVRERRIPRAVAGSRVSVSVGELVKDASNLHDPNPIDSEHVYQQLLGNFQPQGIAWVKTIPWTGPIEIPLSRIDWAGKKSWAASHQGARVKVFRQRIRAAGQDVNPVILVQVPGNDKCVIVDGHHRALAYQKENRPVKAYVGFASSDSPSAPWFQTHDYQINVDGQPANKSAKITGDSAGNITMKSDILRSVPELSPDDIETLPTVWEFASKSFTAGADVSSGAISGLVPYDLVGQKNEEKPEEEGNQDDDAPGNWEPVSFARKNTAGKIIIRLAHLAKVGKEGYIHGYICVRPPCGPQYSEAVFNTKNGKVLAGDGTQIGALRKNTDGTYSMTHHDADGKKTKLASTFTNRADAAKSVVLYHNINEIQKLAPGDLVDAHLENAKQALAAGDHVGAGVEMAKAEEAANAINDKLVAEHVHDTGLAISDAPKPVNAPMVNEPASALPLSPDELLAGLDETFGTKPTKTPSISEPADPELAQWEKDLLEEPPTAVSSASPIDEALAKETLPQKISAVWNLTSDDAVQNDLANAAAALISGDHETAGTALTEAGHKTTDITLAHAMYTLAEQAYHPVKMTTPVKLKVKPKPSIDTSAYQDAISAINGDVDNINANGHLTDAHIALSNGDTESAIYHLDAASDTLFGIDPVNTDKIDTLYYALKTGKQTPPIVASPVANTEPSKFQDEIDSIDGTFVFGGSTGNDNADAMLQDAKDALVAGNSQHALDILADAKVELGDVGGGAFDAVSDIHDSLNEKLHPSVSIAPASSTGASKLKKLKTVDLSDINHDINVAKVSFMVGSDPYNKLENAGMKLLAGDTQGALDSLYGLKSKLDDYGSDDEATAVKAIHDKLSVAAGLTKTPKKPKKLKPADAKAVYDSITAAQNNPDIAFGSIGQTTLGNAKAKVLANDTPAALSHLQEIIDATDDGKKIAAIQAIHDKISVAAGLKKASEVKPAVPYTVQNADELAGSLTDAAKIANPLIYDSKTQFKDLKAVADQLKAGNAAEVIRSARKLDMSLTNAGKYAYGDTKAEITAARAQLKKSLSTLEKQHDKDLSFQSFTDRANKIRDDVDNAPIVAYHKTAYHGMINSAVKMHADGDTASAEERLRVLAKNMTSKYNSDDSKAFAPDVKKLADSITPKKVPAEKLGATEAPGEFTLVRDGDIGSSTAEGFMATGNKVTGKPVNTSQAGKYKNNASHLIADEMKDISTQDLAKMATANHDNTRIPASLVRNIAANGIANVSVNHSADVFSSPGSYFTGNYNTSKAKVNELLGKLLTEKVIPDDVRQELAKPATQDLLRDSNMSSEKLKLLSAIGTNAGIFKSKFGSDEYVTAGTYGALSIKATKAVETQVTRDTLSAHLSKLDAISGNDPMTAEDERHLRAELISPAIELWKQSSNNAHIGALAVQRAAADEFGIPSVKEWAGETNDLKTKTDKYYAENQTALRKFVRAQYDLTQRELKKAGITSVTLHRALSFSLKSDIPDWAKTDHTVDSYGSTIKSAGSTAELKSSDWRPLSSWSHASSEASKFYGDGGSSIQVVASVPANLVVSTPRTGNGCLREREWVVMSAPGQVKIEKSKSY